MFLARKHHHIAQGKMARKAVKEESDYHKRSDKTIVVWSVFFSGLAWIC